MKIHSLGIVAAVLVWMVSPGCSPSDDKVLQHTDIVDVSDTNLPSDAFGGDDTETQDGLYPVDERHNYILVIVPSTCGSPLGMTFSRNFVSFSSTTVCRATDPGINSGRLNLTSTE